MNHPTPRPLRAASLFVLALCLSASAGLAAAQAAPAGKKAASSAAQQAHQLFKAEMAYCASGQSVQERRVCEQEARAAHAQNLRGALADDGARYRENARQRCQALAAGGEREVCLKRVDGLVKPGELQVVPGSESPLLITTPPPRN